MIFDAPSMRAAALAAGADIGSALATKLNGRECPPHDDHEKFIAWWGEARARYATLYLYGMIKGVEGGQ